MSDTVIAFFADGNSIIAGGHLRRCLTIAEELQKKGISVPFFVSDEESAAMLRLFAGSDAVDCTVLACDWHRPSDGMRKLAEGLAQSRATTILVDHYDADDAFLQALHRTRPDLAVAVLDDFVTDGRPADRIINYTAPGRSAWVPLRSQFRDCRMPVRNHVARVLLSTGSVDPLDIRRDLEACLGQALPDAEIVIPEGVADMAALMADCDLAVSAGGTTVYELCAVGVPAVIYTMADNQQALAEGISHAVPCAGDVRTPSGREKTLRAVADWLERMASDEAARREQSEKQKRITDGRGAERIAECLMQLDASHKNGAEREMPCS